MNFQEFKASVANKDLAAPPAGLSKSLQALWFSHRGDWDHAHTLAQEADSADGDWVHAYLHRVEGDPANASYWYHRARKPVCTDSLPLEWEAIAAALTSEA
ncbi:MAG: hypothetical protein ACAI35_14615 [Candidatus Methylacidiphilales bacterium]|nr:hypothetical protein [Candidatus Methylacidiphilales bacterium]